MAELPVGGPLVEADLGDEMRSDPRGALLSLKVHEGRRWLRQRAKTAIDVREDVLGKTRAHAAHVAKVAPRIGSEEERAEIRAGTGRGGVSADHELLLVVHLDLEPAGRAARDVWRHRVLRHEPLAKPSC